MNRLLCLSKKVISRASKSDSCVGLYFSQRAEIDLRRKHFKMESVRGRAIKDIHRILSMWVYNTKFNNSVNYTDTNIDAEDIACGLLNRVYSWNLINLNNLQLNYPGVDLGDKERKVCVQVTSDRTARKIKDTVSLFDQNNLADCFQSLYIFCLTERTCSIRTEIKSETIEFSVRDNVITVGDIILKINSLDETTIIGIKKYLNSCFVWENEGIKDSVININEFLSEQMKEVSTICYSKMESLGLSHDLAENIWTCEISDFKMPNFRTPITYIVGGFGAGKSHFLYTVYMHLWNAYINTSQQTVLPVFIQGRKIDVKAGLKEWLKKEIAFENEALVFVIIDGLDEMPFRDAEILIEELKIIENQSSNFQALVATRPLSFIEDKCIYPMPPLSHSEIRKLYSTINNGTQMEQSLFHGYNGEAFKEMLAVPLFSILYALYSKDRARRITNAMDLVNVFIEKSLKKVLDRKPDAKTQLEKLAALTIDRNLKNINQTEIGTEFNSEIMLSTGLISKYQDSYFFTLPIIAQWLGAMAIRDGIKDYENIFVDTEMTFAWRYPLSILFSQISFEESEEYFTKIIQVSPGMASLVIRGGVCFENSGSMPAKNVSVGRLRKTLECWLSIFSNINFCFTSQQGNLNTLWYQQNQNHIQFSFADTYLGKDVIYDLMPDEGKHFHTVYGRHVYAQATWPWITSFEIISDFLSEIIKTKPFILKGSIMEREWLWKSTLKIKGIGSLFSGEISIEDIKTMTNDYCVYKGIDLKDYYDALERCNYQDTIRPPFPVGDIDHYESGLIWGNYSEKRMLERIQFIYQEALDSYRKFIDTFFPKLREQLSTYLLLPVRLDGVLSFKKSDSIISEAPLLYRIAYPIEYGEENIVDISLNEYNEYRGEKMEHIKNADNACMRLRREHYPYIHVVFYSGRCFDAEVTPVTNLLYRWLESDLKNIGWIR